MLLDIKVMLIHFSIISYLLILKKSLKTIFHKKINRPFNRRLVCRVRLRR